MKYIRSKVKVDIDVEDGASPFTEEELSQAITEYLKNRPGNTLHSVFIEEEIDCDDDDGDFVDD